MKDSIRPILPPPPPSVKRGIAERQQHTEQISSPTITSPTAAMPSSVTLPSGSLSSNDVDKQFTDFEVTKISNSNATSNDLKDEEDLPWPSERLGNRDASQRCAQVEDRGRKSRSSRTDEKIFYLSTRNQPIGKQYPHY
ncbi:hypothetical protein KQX54_016564 [Cotesia glomerata]|uniref:Uncharacterized protein n=1 Tax=Cotesia glomerata TaxID=32391 RepID=A0AAV7ISZ5_COTGL|nr:hypothetical protein KQX54_016564 [Cotesia glomerata]